MEATLKDAGLTEVSGTGVKVARCTLTLVDTRVSVLQVPDFSAEIEL